MAAWTEVVLNSPDRVSGLLILFQSYVQGKVWKRRKKPPRLYNLGVNKYSHKVYFDLELKWSSFTRLYWAALLYLFKLNLYKPLNCMSSTILFKRGPDQCKLNASTLFSNIWLLGSHCLWWLSLSFQPWETGLALWDCLTEVKIS